MPSSELATVLHACKLLVTLSLVSPRTEFKGNQLNMPDRLSLVNCAILGAEETCPGLMLGL